jgi:hypothetical protein
MDPRSTEPRVTDEAIGEPVALDDLQPIGSLPARAGVGGRLRCRILTRITAAG